ncbi:MalY/PatB family protein [Paenibacillus cremeus]|uniref:cysteine-S-conjugate beta-lyase n=1 Tax=Paenibacillus cremeus TaxID=2163881 RepID=A0A559K8K7_9BACL|nr:MalY/PatB family protein [Paenibacillus cremeus]TVY08462.1 pyridoxal phosphate-dependent aminotransferase [Paenibacillus cremeus]
MTHNFDREINRRNTNSYKWDQSEKLFGSSDIVPLWVADMDFEGPPAVKAALEKRASLGVYGYTIKSEDYYKAITSWFQRRHHWTIQPEWISDSPGIVTSLSLAVDLFSEPGSQVILQSPVYYPFYDVIKDNGRVVAKNPLLLQNGRYEMDYAHLEELMQGGAKLLLLCNPHNPGGRVWTREDLERLGELILKHGVTVISDEIHCDMTFEGHPYTPFASLSKEIANLTVTLLAPSKTFNMPSLHASFAVSSNPEFKRTFDKRLKTLSLHMTNFFVPCAVEAAFNEGDAWLDELIPYIYGNMEYASNYLSEHLPEVKPMRPEGTYLLWIDCRGLGLDVKQLKALMFEQAKVAFSEGSVFGTEAQGYLRINLACTRRTLQDALEKFCRAAAAVRQGQV